MTATSGCTTEPPISHEREDRLVVLVGFRNYLSTNAIGRLERCQLSAVEFPNPHQACRVLETIRPDAVVLDTHHAELKYESEVAARLMRVLEGDADEGSRIPIVVLTSSGLSDELRDAFVRAGAVLLRNHLQTYLQIATLIRRLCGLRDGCCMVGESPQPRFNIRATLTSHRRY